MIGLRTLVLNATYMPISLLPLHTIPTEDAMTRVFNGTCHIVGEYDRKIQSPNISMNWPSVIARNDYVNIKNKVQLRRESLFYRDHGICVYCHKSLKISEVTYDHLIPKTFGGLKTWENVVASCSHCNSSKGDNPATGIWKPKYKPYKPDYHQLLNNRRKFPLIVDDKSWMSFVGKWESDVTIRV